MLGYILRKVDEVLHPAAVKKSSVDKSVWLGSRTFVYKSAIEYGTYIGNNCQCLNVKIGKFCSIANNCYLGGAEHPLDYVSTSPVFYGGYRKTFIGKLIKLGDLEWNSYRFTTVIGNDVWIGNDVILKSGISIGNGSVIGAGSVVTKNVPPYEIWAGNPAKLIRKRFSDDAISKLQELKWWNNERKILSECSAYMDDIDNYIKHLEIKVCEMETKE